MLYKCGVCRQWKEQKKQPAFIAKKFLSRWPLAKTEESLGRKLLSKICVVSRAAND